MKPLAFLIFLAAFLTSCQSVQPGSAAASESAGHGEIRYKRQSSAENEAARQRVITAFASGSGSVENLMSEKAVLCGSGCWGRTQRGGLEATQDFIPATSYTPVPGGRIEREGAMIMSKKGRTQLAKSLVEMVGRHPRVRPLSSRELELYWALVPFDLKDPIMIIEGKGRRVVGNLGWSQGGDRLAHVEDLAAFEEKVILGN